MFLVAVAVVGASQCLFLSFFFFLWLFGLRIAAGEEFSGKNMECVGTSTNAFLLICIFWQRFCWQRILWPMAWFCRKPRQSDTLICEVQDLSWIRAVEISLPQHSSYASERWTKLFSLLLSLDHTMYNLHGGLNWVQKLWHHRRSRLWTFLEEILPAGSWHWQRSSISAGIGMLSS